MRADAHDMTRHAQVLSKAKSKNPHELCTKLQVALERLGDSASDKQQEEVGKYLSLMKACPA